MEILDACADSDGLMSRKEFVDPTTFNSYTKDFYPYLNKPVDKIYKEFFESKSNILLLAGPSGSGKTTFCRNLLKYYSNKAMIANSKTLFHNSDVFIRYSQSDAGLLVIEDVDDLITARKDGNNVMSYLLNLSDGIIPNNKKVVISTNLPGLNSIDDAVLRLGRCYDMLLFRKLSTSEAMLARSSIGKEYIDLNNIQDKWTLAEALNYDPELNIKNRNTFSVGFSSS